MQSHARTISRLVMFDAVSVDGMSDVSQSRVKVMIFVSLSVLWDFDLVAPFLFDLDDEVDEVL